MNPDRPLVVITGVSGFIGGALCRTCHDAGYDVIGIDVVPSSHAGTLFSFHQTPLELCSLRKVIGDRVPQAIFHLAGKASVPASVADPFGDFMSLLPGTARLCSEIRDTCPHTRLVLFSSAAVYGEPQDLPISEDAPIQPISPYGLHKALAESLVSQYSAMWGFPLTILRVFSAYGPGLRKQVLWDLSLRALHAARNGERSLALRGTGLEGRDFIHVDDIAAAAMHLVRVRPPTKVERINVASGTQTSIAQVAAAIIDRLNLTLALDFDGEVRVGDPRNWCADVTRLRNRGFEATTSLDDGIKTYVDWMCAHTDLRSSSSAGPGFPSSASEDLPTR